MTVDRRQLLGGFAAGMVAPGFARAAESAATIFEARPGTLALQPGQPTNVWAYNGQVPGPTIRVRKGEEVHVRLVNKLSQPTTLCWHGVRIANVMDGVGGLTQKPVMPGESFDYRFTPPDSGLFWYHPHVVPQGAEQISRGLYGALLVEDQTAPKIDDDILIVIADWALDEKGQVKGGFLDPGRVGSVVTINGKPIPGALTAKPGARLRLRLLNACAERITLIGIEAMQSWVVAIDGQPSEIFQPGRATVPIGPGSRFELMADLPRETAMTPRLVLRKEDGSSADLLKIALKDDPAPTYPAVAKLGDNPLLPTRIPLERSLKRDLAIEKLPESKTGAAPWRWSLGGVPSDGTSGKPVFSVKRGGAVTLAFVNKTNVPQQMHIHGHVFRILHDLDDGWDPYWRESILLIPGKTKHIAFIADNPGKWMIESLMLSRQMTGLAGWFEVT